MLRKKEGPNVFWKTFNPEVIPEYVANDQVVFVDLTAF